MRNPLALAAGSLAVGILVFVLKLGAYLATGSIGLYSDALESIVNIAASGAALLAIRVGARPADENHPFGHSKAEYFSAVAEGVLIIGAAVLILVAAVKGIADPQEIEAPGVGLGINLVATAINAGWAFVLIRQGRRGRSPALVADGRHLFADVVTSVGVVIGILLALLTDAPVIDPIVAALVALNVLWSGWHVVRGSVGGLMDEAAPPEEVARISGVIAANAEGALEAHDLKTRHAGPLTFVEFHLVVPGTMPVIDAHAICDRIEAAIRTEVPGARITIHVEPEHKAKHGGIVFG